MTQPTLPVYIASDNEENFWGPEGATREEALKALVEDADLKVGDTVFVGIQEPCEAHLPKVDFDDLRDSFEVTSDLCGDWPGSTKEQEVELNAALDKVFQEWLTRHGLQPSFYRVREVTTHTVPEDRWGADPITGEGL